MLTCTKIYSDIPFAHRQHLHDGHCSFIHGHNWSFVLTFSCRETDANGFVVDFGKLKFLKKWIKDNLDHACVFNRSDPMKKSIIESCPDAFKVFEVESCGCEGIAQALYPIFNNMVARETDGRVWIQSIEVVEDSKNSAKYCPS